MLKLKLIDVKRIKYMLKLIHLKKLYHIVGQDGWMTKLSALQEGIL